MTADFRWPNLPEDYGEGQRQYDMACAALRVADGAAMWVALCIAIVVWMYAHSALIAYPSGALAWWLYLRPHKKRRDAARALWSAERDGYAALLEAGKL